MTRFAPASSPEMKARLDALEGQLAHAQDQIGATMALLTRTLATLGPVIRDEQMKAAASVAHRRRRMAGEC